jgi:fructose-1,6-bisphosphatase-3
VGDIYDRGPGAHIIMDSLEKYHAVDIQWGNHDVLWMGAAAGCESCIANVIRISMRYANLETIEDGYGINLLPLATFAMDAYKDDPCDAFTPKVGADNPYKEKTIRLMAQMHKAIAMIQFKLEYDIIRRRPEFGMESRNLLDKIDFERGVVRIGETEYPMKDMNFPTIDHNDPYRLTDEERELMDSLKVSFLNSEKLDRHIRLMYTKGSLYKICNSNLLYHASIPMTAEGEFKKVTIQGETYSGRSLLDKIDQLVREAYFLGESNKQREFAVDFMWYLWCGPDSPLFDKDQMTTFERYFIADKATHKERKGAYYTLMSDEDICLKILHEFGIDKDEHSHIINGHIPVKTIKGETPIRANGRLLVIDGGFSKAYQPETGIAGYTLVFNSYGLSLIQHQPFESTKKAIEEGRDIISSRMVLETTTQRMHVRDTDIGKELLTQIADLEKLLEAYSSGLIAESR